MEINIPSERKKDGGGDNFSSHQSLSTSPRPSLTRISTRMQQFYYGNYQV